MTFKIFIFSNIKMQYFFSNFSYWYKFFWKLMIYMIIFCNIIHLNNLWLQFVKVFLKLSNLFIYSFCFFWFNLNYLFHHLLSLIIYFFSLTILNFIKYYLSCFSFLYLLCLNYLDIHFYYLNFRILWYIKIIISIIIIIII